MQNEQNGNTSSESNADHVDKSPDKIRGMFDQIAPRYDLLNHLLSLGIDHYWRYRLARRVRPSATSRVLDVCTGTGDLALSLWRASGRKAHVFGIDFSPRMIDFGQQKVAARGAQELVDLQVGDAEQLPGDDGEFDIVTVGFGLRNVSRTQQGLNEMARVCRPGGQVAILEFTTPRLWPIGPIYAWYFRAVLPRIGRLVSRDTAAYSYLPQSVGQFPQYDELADLMRLSGLRDVTYSPMTFGVVTLYVGTKPK